MHPLVEAAMSLGPQGMTPENLEKILDIQKSWEANEALKAFNIAMSAMNQSLPKVLRRDALVEFGNTKYRHTSLAEAVDAIKGPLNNHGFTFRWETDTETPGSVKVTCILSHIGGHEKPTAISAPPDTKGSKNPAQAVMSTVTMLQRYTLLSLLGIATADMTDPAPRAQAPADDIDSNRTLKALASLRKYKKTKVDAEAFLGRPVAAWTNSDLDRLREWLVAPRAAPAARAAPAPRVHYDDPVDVAEAQARGELTAEQAADEYVRIEAARDLAAQQEEL